jgi:putative NADH-flavin reductase
MEELNVNRLICQTTLGCGESWNNLNFFWKKIMFGWFLKKVFIAHENQEKVVFQSDLDWTIVRPSAFTNGELTKKFKTDFSSGNNSLKLKISRADVAYFMLQQLTSSKYNRKAVGISY